MTDKDSIIKRALEAKKYPPAYTSLNPTPKSPHGKHWRTSSKAHSNPVVGTDQGAGSLTTAPIRTQLPATSWRTFNYSSHAPIPHAGIRAGEIIGYRAWWVMEGLQLKSLAHYFIWEPGMTVDGDIDKSVDMFARIFGGVYAFRERYLCREEFKYPSTFFPYQGIKHDKDNWMDMKVFCNGMVEIITYIGLAFGTIKMWGEVVEHELGYRSQYAKLVSIDEVIGCVDLNELRAKYLGQDGPTNPSPASGAT